MFKGRYGNDKLNWTMLITAGVLSLLSLFTGRSSYILYAVFSGLATFLIVYSVVRMFSRNFYKREAELNVFLNFLALINSCYNNKTAELRARHDERKTYKRFTCPQCGQNCACRATRARCVSPARNDGNKS